MPRESAYTSKAYRGNIILEFRYGSDKSKKVTRITIPNEQIIYIMVEENYMERVLPIIYISISVNSDTYEKIINKRETAKFYLNISSTDVLSKTSVNTESFKGEFKYIPETTNADFAANLNRKKKNSADTSYRTINIGLVSDAQTQLLRQYFNGIYKNIDTSTLISMAVSNLYNVVIEPLDFNKEYKQIIIPPITSVYKLLEYIYEKDAFYNTPFRFFMGFNKTYLLSQKGEAFTTGMNKITMRVEDITSDDSLLAGFIKDKKNKEYHVFLNGSDVKYSSNQATPQVMNSLVTFDDESDATFLDLENSGSGRTEFVRTEYGNVTKNDIDSSELTIDVVKDNIDGSLFTPEKQYTFTVNESSYNRTFEGIYILTYKKTFYKSTDGRFNITCSLGFKASSSNLSAHASYELKKRKASSASAKKSKSSDTKATSATTSARNKKSSSSKNSSNKESTTKRKNTGDIYIRIQ